MKRARRLYDRKLREGSKWLKEKIVTCRSIPHPSTEYEHEEEVTANFLVYSFEDSSVKSGFGVDGQYGQKDPNCKEHGSLLGHGQWGNEVVNWSTLTLSTPSSRVASRTGSM